MFGIESNLGLQSQTQAPHFYSCIIISTFYNVYYMLNELASVGYNTQKQYLPHLNN